MRGVVLEHLFVFLSGLGPAARLHIRGRRVVGFNDGLSEQRQDCHCRDHVARTFPRKRPVRDPGDCATCSGVPEETMCPPAFPPSGPRSITQSADLMTSTLCSMISTVPPASMRRLNARSSLLISSKCKPVVGSSKIKSVFSLVSRDRYEASLMR